VLLLVVAILTLVAIALLFLLGLARNTLTWDLEIDERQPVLERDVGKGPRTNQRGRLAAIGTSAPEASAKDASVSAD
jgi:hypothetical protein